MEEFRPKLTKKLENLDFYKLKNYVKEWENNSVLNKKRQELKEMLKLKNKNRIYDYEDEKLGTDFKKETISKKWFKKSKIELTQYEYESLQYFSETNLSINFNEIYNISIQDIDNGSSGDNFHLTVETPKGLYELEEFNYDMSITEIDEDKIFTDNEVENINFLIKNVIMYL
jgi:hypothetical protein